MNGDERRVRALFLFPESPNPNGQSSVGTAMSSIARTVAACSAAAFVSLSGFGCDAAPGGGPRGGPQTGPTTDRSILPSTAPGAPVAPPSAPPSAPPAVAAAPQPVIQPATQPAPAPAPNQRPRFGVNLERLVSWSRSRVYIDAVRTAYGFDTIAHPRDGKAPLGPGGLPSRRFRPAPDRRRRPDHGRHLQDRLPRHRPRDPHRARREGDRPDLDADSGVTRADLHLRPRRQQQPQRAVRRREPSTAG